MRAGRRRRARREPDGEPACARCARRPASASAPGRLLGGVGVPQPRRPASTRSTCSTASRLLDPAGAAVRATPRAVVNRLRWADQAEAAALRIKPDSLPRLAFGRTGRGGARSAGADGALSRAGSGVGRLPGRSAWSAGSRPPRDACCGSSGRRSRARCRCRAVSSGPSVSPSFLIRKFARIVSSSDGLAAGDGRGVVAVDRRAEADRHLGQQRHVRRNAALLLQLARVERDQVVRLPILSSPRAGRARRGRDEACRRDARLARPRGAPGPRQAAAARRLRFRLKKFAGS